MSTPVEWSRRRLPSGFGIGPWIVGLLTVTAGACGGSSSDDARTTTPAAVDPAGTTVAPDVTEPASTDEQIDGPATTEAREVGTAEVASPDGRAVLTFDRATLPTGVRSADVRVEVDASSNHAAAYRLEPAGLEFAAPATMHLTLDVGLDVPMFAIVSDDGSVELLDIRSATVDDTGATILYEVAIEHFSQLIALNGPSPIGTAFTSPSDGSVFAVGDSFGAQVRHSANRDVVTQVLVTDDGPLSVRLPPRRLELILGRELHPFGPLVLDGAGRSQVEIDVDDGRPSSEAIESYGVTCAEEGEGQLIVLLGVTDLPLELVDAAGAVVAELEADLIVHDTRTVGCEPEALVEPALAAGEWRGPGTFVYEYGSCAGEMFDTEIGVVVHDGEGPLVPVKVIQYAAGTPFHSADGFLAGDVFAAVGSDPSFDQVWLGTVEIVDGMATLTTVDNLYGDPGSLSRFEITVDWLAGLRDRPPPDGDRAVYWDWVGEYFDGDEFCGGTFTWKSIEYF